MSDQVISLAQAIRLQQVLDKPLPNSRSELDPEIRQDGAPLAPLPVTQPGEKITDWPRHLPGCWYLKRRKLNRLRTTAGPAAAPTPWSGND